jgi:hypothetical protein
MTLPLLKSSSHGRRLQSATFRCAVAWPGNPSVQFGMHSPPAVSAEEDRQCQRMSLQLTDCPNLPSPSYPGNCISIISYHKPNSPLPGYFERLSLLGPGRILLQ